MGLALQGVSFSATPPEARQGASSQPVQLGQMSPSPFANSAVPLPPQPVANGHHQSTLEPAASAAQLARCSIYCWSHSIVDSLMGTVGR